MQNHHVDLTPPTNREPTARQRARAFENEQRRARGLEPLPDLPDEVREVRDARLASLPRADSSVTSRRVRRRG